MLRRTFHLLSGAVIASSLCAGAAHSSLILQADFNGPDNGTGGATDMASLGATAKTFFNNTIDATTPFAPGSGSYSHYGTQGPDGGYVIIKPLAPASSPAALTPVVGTDRVMNGGLDFFMRSDHALTASEMRFFDISGETGGLRIFLDSKDSDTLRLYVTSPTNGIIGGNDDSQPGSASQRIVDASFNGGFLANTVYHVGVTFETDGTGVVTAKVYIKEGIGAIDLVNDVAGGSVTFGIDENNTTGGLRDGTFTVNKAQKNKPASHDMDTFRLYDAVPTTFEALVIPEPATLGLMGIGLLLLSKRSSKQ